MASVRAIAVALILPLLVALSAAAQNTPQAPASADALKGICTAFIDQSGQKVGGDANRLCTCLVRETKSHLTEDEMRSYSAAVTSGQAPPDAVLQKVLGIAQTCITESR